ncbi:MAG: trigger factor [Ruminococcaceae bacterium]|nr:trigger factor [Oscillospiraceae bacterium]
MRVTKKQVEKNVMKLTISVDSETFQKGIEKAYRKIVKQINLPGFRKGKAPRKVIEQYYGKEVFYEDAINFVCQDTYPIALDRSGINPVDMPEIDVEKIDEENGSFVYTATVTVKPEVELGEYKGIEVEKVSYETKDEDIDAELKKAQEQNARIITVEDREVKNGDMTVIDFEGFVDGVAFEGGKGTDYSLEIGSGTFIPGFEEQIVGAKLNEEIDVNVTFPEEYHSEELKGKPALFKVTVKEIKEKQLPEINDDFIKDISEFDTVDEYKADIKAKLDKSNEDKAKAELENKLVEKLVEGIEVEIPECMIKTQLDNIAQDFDYRLQMQGMSLQKYVEMTSSTLDAFKEQFKDQALSQVKTQLALEAVAKNEKITSTAKDVEAEMKKMADMYGMELDKIKKMFRDEDKKSLEAEIITRKTIEFLVENAKIK